MTANQEPTLRACIPCKRAILEADGWTLEKVIHEVELSEAPSVEAPQSFETCIFVELFSALPVNAGRLSLAVRGPAGEHFGGCAATVDRWDPKKKHFATGLAIGVWTSVCSTLRFEVLWNGKHLGGCTLKLKPPGKGNRLFDLGIQSTLLDPAQAEAEYKTANDAVAA